LSNSCTPDNIFDPIPNDDNSTIKTSNSVTKYAQQYHNDDVYSVDCNATSTHPVTLSVEVNAQAYGGVPYMQFM